MVGNRRVEEEGGGGGDVGAVVVVAVARWTPDRRRGDVKNEWGRWSSE